MRAPVGGVEEVAVGKPAGDAQADDLKHATEQRQLVHSILRREGTDMEQWAVLLYILLDSSSLTTDSCEEVKRARVSNPRLP